MRVFKAIASLALVIAFAGAANAQTGGGMPTGGSTGGGPAGGSGGTPAAKGPIEKDIDLPLEKPILKTPPKPVDPPPPPPPPPPIEPPPPTIYGKDLKSENGTVFFVIDISGSMGGGYGSYTTADGKTAAGNKLARAKAELTKAILSLPKNFKYNMIAYDCSIRQWQGSLVQADDAGKNQGIAWVNAMQPTGATGTGPATAAALALKENKLVVLLTDGAPNCGASGLTGHRAMIANNNSQKATINVFGIQATGYWKQFCMDVASDGGGSYTDVN